jgi:CheY-like chemotaxis protein
MSRRPCILIVGDDVDLCEAVAEILRIEGYSVATAHNGKQALEILEKMGPEQPCLVLLDFLMPEMDGEEFARALQAQTFLFRVITLADRFTCFLRKKKSVEHSSRSAILALKVSAFSELHP